MRLIEDQLYKEQDKISQFSWQNIHLQSENEKIAELRKLEKKNHDLKSTSDLGAKVCQNCIQTYPIVEDLKFQLNDEKLKRERFESQYKELLQH